MTKRTARLEVCCRSRDGGAKKRTDDLISQLANGFLIFHDIFIGKGWGIPSRFSAEVCESDERMLIGKPPARMCLNRDILDFFWFAPIRSLVKPEECPRICAQVAIGPCHIVSSDGQIQCIVNWTPTLDLDTMSIWLQLLYPDIRGDLAIQLD